VILFGKGKPGNGAAQTKLRDVVEGRGFTLAHWLTMATDFKMLDGTGVDPASITNWLAVPESTAHYCVENTVEMVGELAAVKAKEKAEKAAAGAKPKKTDNLL
jgi:hypothetical protein